MTRFGPAGNCDRFYAENHKSTLEAPAWLAAQGLDAFEYSAGRGVSLSEKTARAIGQQARLHGVALSIHAPYYINCAAAGPEKREKSIQYLLDAARACCWMGGERVVFHVGSPSTAWCRRGWATSACARKPWAGPANWAPWRKRWSCAPWTPGSFLPWISATCTPWAWGR